MSFFSTVKSWWSRQWSWLGQTTPIKKSVLPSYDEVVFPKEKSVPVSPTSVSTGSALPNTTATYYGAKKSVKKSKKSPPKPKVKKK